MEQDPDGGAARDRVAAWDEAVAWVAVEEWAVETAPALVREASASARAAATGLPTRREIPAIR